MSHFLQEQRGIQKDYSFENNQLYPFVRRDVLIFMKRQVPVTFVDNYSFEIPINKKVQKIEIMHFGRIKIEGDNHVWDFIDFLDAYFSQKRSTILNNIMKSFSIKKLEYQVFPNREIQRWFSVSKSKLVKAEKIDGYLQLSLLSDDESMLRMACAYRSEEIRSNTPRSYAR